MLVAIYSDFGFANAGIGASMWTFSSDFETLTIENDFARPVPGTPAGKSTEHWIEAGAHNGPPN